MSYNTSYWFARGYYDGRAKGEEDNFRNIPEEYQFAYKSGYVAGEDDYTEFDSGSYDGQPDEAQEWHDYDPDC